MHSLSLLVLIIAGTPQAELRPIDFTALAYAAYSLNASALAAEPEYGNKHSKRWTLLGGIATDFNNNDLSQIGVGLTYFLEDELSAEFEFLGMYFDQTGSSAWGINGNLLLRWHFKEDDDGRWSMFAEGGVGLLFSSNDVPSHGSSFNFTPIIGTGMTIELNDNARFIAGVRWHHISNANTSESNPARDSLMIHTGISVPF